MKILPRTKRHAKLILLKVFQTRSTYNQVKKL